MDNIGSRIQLLRKSKKLTQAEFGKLFGVTHAHISSIERGKENPSEMFMLFIIEKMKVSESWLRNGEGEMYADLPFSTATDSGNITKFEILAENLLEYLNSINGEELRICVDIISYFYSSLANRNFLDDKAKTDYLMSLQKIIKTMDITFCKANSLSVLKGRTEDYRDLLLFSSETQENILQINNAIKDVLNLYISLYIPDEKLGFKIF